MKSVTRLFAATKHSWHGLRFAARHEAAFRQELALLVFLLFVAVYWDAGLVKTLLLIGSVMLVLIVELLNSAIEAVVDRVGIEHHELSGRAKDLGSAAVALALLLLIATWVSIGVSLYW